nr:MAG TPA: hypothetical protein [Caudoviricetes sp.]
MIQYKYNKGKEVNKMKITVMNNKLVPFEQIAEGVVFKDPTVEDYYIKTASVVNEDTGEEEWNCLRLDNYAFDCFGLKDMVYPIYHAELIIP